MTTIFEEKAQKVYAELEAMEQNFALLGQKKKQFETEAIAAREDETKAKQSVSRALLNGDEPAAEAFRKTAKEKAEFAEEREEAAKEADAAIAEAKQTIYHKKQAADRAGYFALKEHSIVARKKMRPQLQAMLEMVTAHDHEQSRRRPGQDRHSYYSRLFHEMARWFEIGKSSDPTYILRKFDEELNAAIKCADEAAAAGIVSKEEAEEAKAEFLTKADFGATASQIQATSSQTVELAPAEVEADKLEQNSAVHPRHQARHERARMKTFAGELGATLGSAGRKHHEPV